MSVFVCAVHCFSTAVSLCVSCVSVVGGSTEGEAGECRQGASQEVRHCQHHLPNEHGECLLRKTAFDCDSTVCVCVRVRACVTGVVW